ncbi:Flagellum site-determining protein YlxH [Andreprevotia sp. IGB-42]|uniref:MinD/ParA family ATP-binding protein n=1 Tax=Andreprevotia sp. IGB-42 TaxID=2497473 RepID=UPI001358CEE7|nr:AAA family ATPase [Andreprevotia sp. IGB-42]KAF0813050.1 Flagellum site-determining protein YlxH [Andreprevotia sp. IGB-42]
MANQWPDQAAGLRALIAPTACRSVGLCGGRGGVGTTTIAIHLAAALAERQREVIVLDEYSGLSNTAHRLRLSPRYDFEDAVRREVPLADTLLSTTAGFSVLPVSARPQTLAALNERELARLGSEFDAITGDADFLLLDTRPATGPGVPSLSLAADDVVVIVSERAESLTDAYATIKLLYTEYARREFRILVNRVDSLTEANFLFQRIKRVAQDYLGSAVQLRLIGFVPEDELLKRATRLGKTVLDAFPDAESGHAFRQLADAMLRWRQPAAGTDRASDFVYRLVESSRILTDRMHY